MQAALLCGESENQILQLLGMGDIFMVEISYQFWVNLHIVMV